MHQTIGSAFAIPSDASVIDVDPKGARAWIAFADGATVSLIDTATGNELVRRTFDGCRWPRRFGPHLILERPSAGMAVAPADLSAGAETLIADAAALLIGVAGGVAHIRVETREDLGDSVRFTFQRVVVELASRNELRRGQDGAGALRFPDPEHDLGLHVVGSRIAAFRSSTGESLWSIDPFEGAPINSIDGIGLVGERLHVRASTIDDDGPASLVLSLDSKSGKPTGPLRRSSAEINAWIGDRGAEVEALVLELDGFAHDLPDGIALDQDDQLVIVRSATAGAQVQRLAKPRTSGTTVVRNHLWGIAKLDSRTELILVRLPDRGDGQVVTTRFEPRGPTPLTRGEVATVTFVGSTVPYVIAVHEKYGRINLPRGDEHAGVKKGDQVLLRDVRVKPGNVVSVAHWHLGAEPPARRVVELDVGPLRSRKRRVRERPRLLEPLTARATEAGVALPTALVALIRQVEENVALRSALADAGFNFEEDELSLDLLEEISDLFDSDGGPPLSSFVPVWGNGFGDSIGGLLADREGFQILQLPEREFFKAGSNLKKIIRENLADFEAEAATISVIERALAAL